MFFITSSTGLTPAMFITASAASAAASASAAAAARFITASLV